MAPTVQLPVEAAARLRESIRSARAAARELEPWLETQPPAVKVIVGRAMSWGVRWIAIAEPLVADAEDQ